MFKFSIRWDQELSKNNVEDITWGKCSISINNKIVWNQINANYFSFLEHLVDSWDNLINEPLLKETATEIDRLEFELNHDLAKAIKGEIVPTILIYRRGNDFEIQIGEEKFRSSYNETLHTLNYIGNYIIQRIKQSNDPRAKLLIKKWELRRNK